jgi:hypothetical protein
MKNTLLAIASFFLTAIFLLQVANAQNSASDVPLEKREGKYVDAKGDDKNEVSKVDGAGVAAVGYNCPEADGSCLAQTVAETRLKEGPNTGRSSGAASKTKGKKTDGKE